MANLRDTVKDYQEELRDGIAWVAIWREGRSWNAKYFYLDLDDTIFPEDKSQLEEIKSIDPAAVILNGYYCGHLDKDMSLDELTAGVRYHYENSMNDIDGFIEAHDDRLPPELTWETRAAAHAAGLPFSEKPYRGDEDIDPYIFDGSMSIEDYGLMHRLTMNEEKSEQPMDKQSHGNTERAGTPEARMTGEQVRTPRGSFYVVSMTAGQMKEAGYGLHHTSDDGKYRIMSNGSEAYAVPAEPVQGSAEAQPKPAVKKVPATRKPRL